MITIVDYGVGNIQALLNMYNHLGVDAQASGDLDTIASADKLLLPGVGAFDKAMSALDKQGLVSALEHAVIRRRVSVLGICLGMQLLARSSEEGKLRGLGWIDAEVKRIDKSHDPNLKVPHMGWAEIVPTRPSLLFPTGQGPDRFYFVHGYHMVCASSLDVVANVDYSGSICCAINRDNIWGVQFHPEKSHRFGMRLLSAFANIIP